MPDQFQSSAPPTTVHIGNIHATRKLTCLHIVRLIQLKFTQSLSHARSLGDELGISTWRGVIVIRIPTQVVLPFHYNSH